MIKLRQMRILRIKCRFSIFYICSFLSFLTFSRVFLATNLDTILKVGDFRIPRWRNYGTVRYGMIHNDTIVASKDSSKSNQN